jgi:hypothetical protein
MGNFTAVGAIIEAFSESGAGIGNGAAQEGCESGVSSITFSDGVARVSGIGGSFVELNRMTLECQNVSTSACIDATNIRLVEWLHIRTAESRLIGSDSNVDCDEDFPIFIVCLGGVNPDLTKFKPQNYLHLESIDSPLQGRYWIGVKMPGFVTGGPLEPSDTAVVLSLGNRVGPAALWFESLQTPVLAGRITKTDAGSIVIVAGVTIVENPLFF